MIFMNNWIIPKLGTVYPLGPTWQHLTHLEDKGLKGHFWPTCVQKWEPSDSGSFVLIVWKFSKT